MRYHCSIQHQVTAENSVCPLHTKRKHWFSKVLSNKKDNYRIS